MKNPSAKRKDSQKIPLSVFGVEGYAKQSLLGYAFHGKWASHTGYRHLALQGQECVQKMAEGLYREQSYLCYLVGDEHKEFGWKTLRINHLGLVEIRLPTWSTPAIKDALSSLGMKLGNAMNCFWSFPNHVEIDQAREALRPLLQPNTRFEDESQLACRLLENFRSCSLGMQEIQLSLF